MQDIIGHPLEMYFVEGLGEIHVETKAPTETEQGEIEVIEIAKWRNIHYIYQYFDKNLIPKYRENVVNPFLQLSVEEQLKKSAEIFSKKPDKKLLFRVEDGKLWCFMSTSWKPTKIEELNLEGWTITASTDLYGGKAFYTRDNIIVEIDLGALDGRSAITITTTIAGGVPTIKKLRHSKTIDIVKELKKAMDALGCFPSA